MTTESNSTVDPAVMDVYNDLSTEWWDETGPANVVFPSRNFLYPYTKRTILASKLVDLDKIEPSKPLAGLKILDVGCGGGVLTEEFAKDSCDAVGLDACSKMLAIAKGHAELNPDISNHISYVLEPIEEHVKHNAQKYDVVIVNYVLLHVINHEQDFFLKNCLKPQGLIFITTINKTWSSWLYHILLLEKIVGTMPVGFNVWDKFTTPNVLKTILEKNNCNTKETRGLFYNVLQKEYKWLNTTSLDYITCAIKV